MNNQPNPEWYITELNQLRPEAPINDEKMLLYAMAGKDKLSEKDRIELEKKDEAFKLKRTEWIIAHAVLDKVVPLLHRIAQESERRGYERGYEEGFRKDAYNIKGITT